ncbi:folate-binding protein [Phytomonospora sp. NPDC050363]|uniref:CAF17-like 4Fe-4S cluster assembly/insertion protein YgfZ n=1 Tax=Phytomonospora sp. NPDC050363 TaxID=3155642 RepID=UPI0033CE4330
MRSVLLERPGAVAPLDGGEPRVATAVHYGEPMPEQRRLAAGAFVDRSDREIVTVTGGARLEWLHSLTTQHLLGLGVEGSETLLLSPNGHVEQAVTLTDDGSTLWLDVAAGKGGALLDFLLKMRFFTPVEIADVTDSWALVTITGDESLPAPDLIPVPPAKFASADVPARPSARYAVAMNADGGWSRRTDVLGVPTVDRLVPRESLASAAAETGLPVVGTWAYDALRVAALRPDVADFDHKTIPHEIPLLASGVHLDKGCYRGQETVARVHNLGRPPRTLVLLHLDGSEEHLPPPGTEIHSGGRVVGTLGTAVRHHELGPVALGLLRRNVAENPAAELTVGTMNAAVDRA